MRIAIFSDNFYPEISGISDSIISLARGLAQRGHKIDFYAPRYSAKDYAVAGLEPEEPALHPNIRIFRLPSLPYPPAPTKQGRFVLPVLASFWRIRKDRPDIIYTQDFFSAGLEALIISRLLKIPLVGTNHTPITEFIKYAPLHAGWINRLALNYVSWYYNHCRWISTPSRPILDEMRRYGFKRPGQVISNPIDLSRYFPAASGGERDRLKRQFGFSQRTILYAGRLAKEKNIDLIIRAAALAKEKFPDVKLAITGHGSAREELEKLVHELGLDKNVVFLGYVATELLPDIYRAADIFSVMSTAETQCISMLQAMATGLPVLGADAWGLPEYIKPENGYLIPPGDYRMLVDKFIYLLEHPQEMGRLGQSGITQAKNFSRETIVDKWEELFREEAHQEPGADQRENPMKLSFVIPAWNEEKFIRRTIERLLREVKNSSRDIEVIVVNNASTDRTREIVLEFPEVILVDESRKGLPRARQAGFEASKGQLIANVDADSLLPSGWIEQVFMHFSHDEELVALSGPYVYYDLPKMHNLLIKLYYLPAYGLHLVSHYLLGKAATIQGGNFVLRRSALEKIGGFNTDINFYGEDTDIAKRIQKVGRVRFSLAFKMYTSGRRLKQRGMLRTAWIYVTNYFWIIFFGKPFHQAQDDLRE